MESVIADSPSYGALIISTWVALAFDARVHDVVTANSTIINVDVPGP